MAQKNIHLVPVLYGASTQLVAHRELRNKYCTNRSIKVWSTYFLLKSLTSSGYIQHWIQQREWLLEFLQINEQTLRSRIKELQRLQLLQIKPGYSLQLVSYKKAASILGIDYAGIFTIAYDRGLKGTNTFAYMLTADEFRSNQDTQRSALIHNLDKNPMLLNLLHELLLHQGCNAQRLKSDPAYLQEQLLKLQERSFKQGSDILGEIMQRRADINRGVKKIAEHHGYKHHRSVTYLKRVMEKLGIIAIEKRTVLSEARSRRYVPGVQSRKNGYMWMKEARITCWTLCDQITINQNLLHEKKQPFSAQQAAAA